MAYGGAHNGIATITQAAASRTFGTNPAEGPTMTAPAVALTPPHTTGARKRTAISHKSEKRNILSRSSLLSSDAVVLFSRNSKNLQVERRFAPGVLLRSSPPFSGQGGLPTLHADARSSHPMCRC